MPHRALAMNGLLLAVIGVLALVAITLHKVRRIHLLGFRVLAELEGVKRELAKLSPLQNDLANLYAQIQSYQDLVSLIRPARPLPLLRGWAASPDFLLEICRHSLAHKPGVIIECSSGASTLALARCCEINGIGHVYSLEHAPEFAEQTRQRLREQGLADWASVIDAPLTPQAGVGGQAWYSMAGLSLTPASCALLVIDGPPWDTAPLARYPALPLLAEFLASSCTIFLDDANRPDEQEAVKRWMAEHPGFQLTQPPCEKGCAKLTRGSTP